MPYVIPGMRFPGVPSRQMQLPVPYQEASDEDDELDCLPQSDIDSSRSAQSDDFCIRPEAVPLFEVESASVGSPSPSRHSGRFGPGSELFSEDFRDFGETDDETDSDSEISNVNNLDLEDDDTCDSEVLPPQLPFVAEEKLQEVWPLGVAAFAIFICPITHDVMTDPVVSADGYTYERAAIARWFETSRKSPVTGQILPHADLVPNQSVRTLLKTLIDMAEKQQASEKEVKGSKASVKEVPSTEASHVSAALRKHRSLRSASHSSLSSPSSPSVSPSIGSSSTHWFGCERWQRSETGDSKRAPTVETVPTKSRERSAQSQLDGAESPGTEAQTTTGATASALASSSSSSSYSSGCVRG